MAEDNQPSDLDAEATPRTLSARTSKLSGTRRKLRIVFSAACGGVCLLTMVLWLRSYWTLDVFVGNLPTAPAFQIASTQGRLYLRSIPSSADSTWSWASVAESQLSAAMNHQLDFLQLQREYQTILHFLEVQRTLAMRQKPERVAHVMARMDQVRVELEVLREATRQRVIAQMPGITTWPLVSSMSATYLGFASNRSATGWSLVCPHWFPTLICGGMAILIGTRPRLRFSLRTFLIAITLLALVLGAIVFAM